MTGPVMAIALYAAAAVAAVGLALRVIRYLRTPMPWRIPTMPAPTTRTGACLRVLREVVLFESLFKASPATWLPGWIFHAALLVVLLAHLRFFLDPPPAPVIFVLSWLRPASLALIAALVVLALRRVCIDRVRYISAPSDHLMLLLLLCIAGSGLLMGTVWPVDLYAIREFSLGLTRPSLPPLPGDPVLVMHLGLAALLLLVFPFSKLLHVPGVLLTPTRQQRDRARLPRQGQVDE